MLSMDPQEVPIHSIAGETPVAGERLESDWLRRRFSEAPNWFPEDTEEHRFFSLSEQARPASVLVPIVMREQGATLLFTQRAAHLSDHPGQISFPGGRVDGQDDSLVDTALREAEEEVGLHRRHVEVMGALPNYFTGTGYKINPVVAMVHPPFGLHIDTGEVAEVFEIPLVFLMDGQHHQRRVFEFKNGTRRMFYTMPYDRFFIWGATAGIVRNLFHYLRA